jgi:RNA recognition motif-containing protein
MMAEDRNRQVFIKNIPYDINEDTLFNWCSTFGSVEKCTLKLDKEGYSRGFAFVTFNSVDGHDTICKDHFFSVYFACSVTRPEK